MDSHSADQPAAGPPADFPSLGEVVDANLAILEQAGVPGTHRLRDRGHLEAALSSARLAFANVTDPGDRVIAGASHLAFGIANGQAFLDGNRRTARAVTPTFLANNDLGHVSPVDKEDHSLARLLNRVVTPAGPSRATVDDFADLFRRRLANRTPRD